MTLALVVVGSWIALDALLVVLRWRAVKEQTKRDIARQIRIASS